MFSSASSAAISLIMFTLLFVALVIVISLAVLIPDLILGIKHAVHAFVIKFKGLFASSPNQGDGNGTA